MSKFAKVTGHNFADARDKVEIIVENDEAAIEAAMVPYAYAWSDPITDEVPSSILEGLLDDPEETTMQIATGHIEGNGRSYEMHDVIRLARALVAFGEAFPEEDRKDREEIDDEIINVLDMAHEILAIETAPKYS